MKSAEARIYHLVTDIPQLLTPYFSPAEVENVQFAIFHWLNNNASLALAASQELSLSGNENMGWRKKLDKQKHYRDLVRVYMLVEISYGRSNISVMRATKSLLLSDMYYGNTEQVVNRLRVKVNHLAALNFNGSYSITFQEADKKEKVRQGYSDAKALLTLVSAKVANPDQRTRERMAYWFGNGVNVPAQLSRNMRLMFETISRRRLLLAPSVTPGSHGLKDIFAETIRNGAVTYPNNAVTIKFGNSYFAQDRCKRIPSVVSLNKATSDLNSAVSHFNSRSAITGTGVLNKWSKSYHTRQVRKQGNVINEKSIISYAGTIIHELTHARLGTDDLSISGHLNLPNNPITTLFGQHSQKVYGHYFCHTLAQHDSTQALNNADNYRLFCEAFYCDF